MLSLKLLIVVLTGMHSSSLSLDTFYFVKGALLFEGW